jgi:hypothetical protein
MRSRIVCLRSVANRAREHNAVIGKRELLAGVPLSGHPPCSPDRHVMRDAERATRARRSHITPHFVMGDAKVLTRFAKMVRALK